MRALAALLVVATHAAYTTGKYTHGYAGLVYSRRRSAPIFFVPSGYLLFGPWCGPLRQGRLKAVGALLPPASRRIMPLYVVTVLVAYVIYHFREAAPQSRPQLAMIAPQPVADPDLHRRLHVLPTAPGPHPDVEPGRCGLTCTSRVLVVLTLVVPVPTARAAPVAAGAGSPALALISLAWMAFVHTAHGLPDGARLCCPAYLAWFIGGMMPCSP